MSKLFGGHFKNLRTISRFEPSQVLSLLLGGSRCSICSGGFDPVHEGHVESILAAAELGPVVVIANGDSFLQEKRYQKPFMPAPFLSTDSRMKVLAAMHGVVLVVESIDEDNTVRATLRALAQAGLNIGWFVNGGDRTPKNVPEEKLCSELGIEMAWEAGGSNKLNESSVVLQRCAAYGAMSATESQETRWGAFCTVASNSGGKIKVLLINPGTGISLQTHRLRSEVWKVLEGQGTLMLGQLDSSGKQIFERRHPAFGESVPLKVGVEANIPVGQAHMVYNSSDTPLYILETWVGPRSSEDDIEKYGDPFHCVADTQQCAQWLTEEVRVLVPAE